MTSIATTKEQSDRLLFCGVSSETADMYYLVDTLHIGQVFRTVGHNVPKEITFAWSQSRLLELLPTPIFYQNGRQAALKIQRAHDGKSWFVSYDFKPDTVTKNGATLVEAAVRMLEYLNNEQNRIIHEIRNL